MARQSLSKSGTTPVVRCRVPIPLQKSVAAKAKTLKLPDLSAAIRAALTAWVAQ